MIWPNLALRARNAEDDKDGVCHDVPLVVSVHWPCLQLRARIAEERDQQAKFRDFLLEATARGHAYDAKQRGERPS